MEEVIEALEENAKEIGMNLGTKCIELQEKANQAIDYGRGSRTYRLRRGEIRRTVDQIQEQYKIAKSIVAVGEKIDIDSTRKLAEEEVESAKENLLEENLDNPYNGSLEAAIESHQEPIKDSLSYQTPLHALRNTVKRYEIILYEINEKMTGIDLETPYNPKENDGEIIEETSSQTEPESAYEPGNMWETI